MAHLRRLMACVAQEMTPLGKHIRTNCGRQMTGARGVIYITTQTNVLPRPCIIVEKLDILPALHVKHYYATCLEASFIRPCCTYLFSQRSHKLRIYSFFSEK